MGFVFSALLLSAIVYALVRGGTDERLAVATLLLGSISTAAIYFFWGRDFTALQYPMLANEAAVFVALFVIALRSKRFWPMPVASFQLVAFLSLLTPFFGRTIVSHGLGVAQGIWAYPQLALIVVGTIRRVRHRAETNSDTAIVKPGTADLPPTRKV